MARVRSCSSAVTSVGWTDVVPAAASRAHACATPSSSALAKSTPAKPFTCRSTRPGIAIPSSAARDADAVDPVVHDLDVSRQELAVDDRRPDPEPHRQLSERNTANDGFLCQAVSTSPERQ